MLQGISLAHHPLVWKYGGSNSKLKFLASQIFILSDEKAKTLLLQAPYCKNRNGAGTFAARIRIFSK